MLQVVLLSTLLLFLLTPYIKNEKGQGPVFNNSLFEDFCEFGFGIMALGYKKMKERVAKLLQEMIDGNANDEY